MHNSLPAVSPVAFRAVLVLLLLLISSAAYAQESTPAGDRSTRAASPAQNAPQDADATAPPEASKVTSTKETTPKETPTAVETNTASPVTTAAPPVASPATTPAESHAAVNAATTEARASSGASATTARRPALQNCKNTVKANVVALRQPFMLNRLGASIPGGLVFALAGDVDKTTSLLKPTKRPRPLVLRANAGDCLVITLTNQITPGALTNNPAPAPTPTPVPGAPRVSIHVDGMQLADISSDGSFVGVNNSSLVSPGASTVYTLYAEREGTYLLYSQGDADTNGQQMELGLFGAVNVEPEGAEWYRSQVTQKDLDLATDRTKGTNGFSAQGQPFINYDAVYPAGDANAGKPILKMLDAAGNIVYSDLTAVITGKNHGRFPGVNGTDRPDPACGLLNNPNNTVRIDPLFCENPALPDRKQPYREITVIYHEVNNAVQAFPVFTSGDLVDTVQPGADTFGINYGTGGIAAEIYANRVGIGPMGECIDCKYEEFFLSSWVVGDPAMVVDVAANTKTDGQPCESSVGYEMIVPPCAGTRVPATGLPYKITPNPKATKVLYPDDPSNTFHSYLNDHVKFRILHGGIGVNHVHHQHAGQWLQTPASDQSTNLDSQMINPGATYTLEMLNGGSGNLNKTAGDWLFHCHFYPHFAAGMWGMWRVHDVFEAGTLLGADGRPAAGARALPDGEIVAGAPIPAVVPMPTLAMAPTPSKVYVTNGRICYGEFVPNGSCDLEGAAVASNPGFPFFIPGVGGDRAPHPPFDFAPQLDATGQPIPGKYLDGGLPRHRVTGGTISKELHTKTDWTKDLATVNAVQLPESGTPVERVAMKFHGTRQHPSFTPEGTSAVFIANGLPRKPSAGFPAQNEFGSQLGAPFADPGVDEKGNAVGGRTPRRYKGAAFQADVTFNRYKWHYPQQRILALWKDVVPTLDAIGSSNPRQPDPLFFRVNSGDVAEFWHTNLVPTYYEADDFQVRTPTDIIGQHIHLVKFDVMASDGAANGFNYEDGTFSPGEVQELIHAIAKGSWNALPGTPASTCAPPAPGQPAPPLCAQPPPADIIDCSKPANALRCKQWSGAQTTVQRWYSNPLLDNAGADRTQSTVFTHDHFGPSTHQQAGLYAGLLVEPTGSKWLNSDNDQQMGSRSDGGPTSWQARIITPATATVKSFREFALEFQDFQLAYDSLGHAVNAPATPGVISSALLTNGTGPGTMSLNYKNEPVPLRVNAGGDLSRAFDSTYNPARAIDPRAPIPDNGDPQTPVMRAYENDPVQVRVLVGAHQFGHFFTIHGMRWLYESGWKNSGYKSAQAMGLSEHFELKFNVPPSSAFKIRRPFSDYLYAASSDDLGLNNGLWGIFRAYVPNREAANLKPLPNNPVGASVPLNYATCPAPNPASPLQSSKVKNFDITATTAEQALPNPNPANPQGTGAIVYNNRGLGRASGSPATVPPNLLSNPWGILYVRTEDLDATGKVKPGVPVEPLVLRAAAGDCINVTLRNAIAPNAKVLKRVYDLQAPFDQPVAGGLKMTLSPSPQIGLNPQLLSYDVPSSYGLEVGYNSSGNLKNQLAKPGTPAKYQWYAGTIDRKPDGTLSHTPVEFGSLNLLPADPLLQHINGLYAAMIVEPENASWTCDGKGADGQNKQVDCWPASPTTDTITSRAAATVTPPVGTPFREFVLLINEDVKMLTNTDNEETRSAVNYRAEPTFYRFGNPNGDTFAANGDNHCSLSNLLVQSPAPPPPVNPLTQADPQTPIFTATAGTPVRFRMLHPPGAGIVQTFTLHGHLWQRNPYVNDSKALGDNKLSQWVGSLDNIGSLTHNDLLIAKAGGDGAAVGDYLYTTFVPSKAQFGLWGIFRVLNTDGTLAAGIPISDCSTPAAATTTTTGAAPDASDMRLRDFSKSPGTLDGRPRSKN